MSDRSIAAPTQLIDRDQAMRVVRRLVEDALLDEQRVLVALVVAITSGNPIHDWSLELRAALALALSVEDGNPGEARKARSLRRHLAGPDARPWPEPPSAPTEQERRRAERIRADLAHLVPLRALRR